jgi:hypothetical protein
MSGTAIPAWALVIGGAGAYLPARHAAGRGEGGLPVITGLMGGLQVAFHVLFCFAQHAAAAASGSATMPAGMRMPAGMSMPGAASATTSTTAVLRLHAMGSSSTGMLLAHALAALMCAWWLRRGEAAAHAVIRCAAFRLSDVWIVTVFVSVPADRTSCLMGIAAPPRDLRSQWLRGIPEQRGPPRRLPGNL